VGRSITVGKSTRHASSIQTVNSKCQNLLLSGITSLLLDTLEIYMEQPLEICAREVLGRVC